MQKPLGGPAESSSSTCNMGELNEQGEAFKDIMQRIIFSARFEDAMPSEYKFICVWYEGTTRTMTNVMFNGEEDPRVQIDSSICSK